MLSRQQIRSFLTVVEEGSIHRAGARLRMSTLTRQMQALEHELGGRGSFARNFTARRKA